MRNPLASIPDYKNIRSVSGSVYHIDYSPRILPNGNIELVESGRSNIQAYIDSFSTFTDMTYIMQQAAAGNSSVLRSGVPQYGDFTSVPTNLAEAMNTVIDAQAAFNRLPAAVKLKFDNDFYKWSMSAGSTEWLERMDIKFEKESFGNEIDSGSGVKIKEVPSGDT